ncbi:synaptonemal complex central element protein 1-like [Pteronotus mesoamericanus]|uniref:synaptonemal complex central element protein 1-like n=1 Tax=Pteronotus mesoamericanus TaxID=1884717 RepID=UPI0023EB1A69|nr:synaptonemal complex central element protein 1-like [Pteronotus parnellii mesoamericanus]
MAGKLEPLEVKRLEVLEEVEEGEGQTKSLKTEDLLAMVKKLQKEGSLEPQIEDLINRINELQQAKKKSSEELGEARALWEALHRELDSLNGEKVHLEEVLRKKQEALRILQLHGQTRASEAHRLHVQEQLEDLMGQHKDLWEFQMLEQRLAWEIRALQSSKEQLLAEENATRAKLELVEQRLRSLPVAEGARAVNEGPKVELEKFGGQVPTQTQRTSEDGADKGEIERRSAELFKMTDFHGQKDAGTGTAHSAESQPVAAKFPSQGAAVVPRRVATPVWLRSFLVDRFKVSFPGELKALATSPRPCSRALQRERGARSSPHVSSWQPEGEPCGLDYGPPFTCGGNGSAGGGRATRKEEPEFLAQWGDRFRRRSFCSCH